MRSDISLEEPAAAARQAPLILALLIGSLLPVFLITYPIPTHAVKIDLPRLPDAVVEMPEGIEPRAYILTSLSLPDLAIEPPGPVNALVLTPKDKVLWNGKEVDMTGLRARLDRVEVEEAWVDFRPHPDARYEIFAEVLAVTRRARLERIRLDNRPYRTSLDERPEPLPISPRR